MPEEKIKVLEEKNIHLWFEDSPVAVLAQKLALDIDKTEFFACFKLLNLQPDNLKDIYFDIICYDANRQVIDTVCDVSYNGFDVARNTEFGYNRRVPVKNQQTRSVEFFLKQVLCSNGHTWINTDSKHFDTALEQQSIFSVQGDLNKQFLEICTRSGIDGTVFSLQPVFNEKFWLCGCGSFNWAHEEVCCECGVGKVWLQKNTSPEVLEKQSGFAEQQRAEFRSQYAEFEKYEKKNNIQTEEFAKRKNAYQKQLKKQKFRKSSKVVITILLILVVLAAIADGIVFFGLPYLKYQGAMTDMEMYRYDNASQKFRELGNFLDSSDLYLKAVYGDAFSSYNSGDYEKAAQLFGSLENYSDAQQKALEARFKSAEKQYHEGQYLEAAKTFHALGDYPNAAANEKQCFSRIYREAQGNLVANADENLAAAFEQLTYLGNYKKSPELLSKCIYLLGNSSYGKCRYGKAIELYRSIPDYAEAQTRLQNIKTLIALLGGATEKESAVWKSDALDCSDCSRNNAVYSLELKKDGNMLFTAQCPDKDKPFMEYKGLFKPENNIIKVSDDNGKNWTDVLKITSLESGKNAVLSAEIVQPVNSVKSLQLKGSTE